MICTKVTANSGFCIASVSGHEFELFADEWFETRDKGVIISVEDWTKIRAYLISSCKQLENCYTYSEGFGK